MRHRHTGSRPRKRRQIAKGAPLIRMKEAPQIAPTRGAADSPQHAVIPADQVTRESEWVTVPDPPPPSRRSNQDTKRKKMIRDSIWPDAEQLVFKAPSPGYCRAVPRIVPLVGVIANHVKGKKAGSLSATYFDLWVRTDNDGFVEVIDESDCAASAEFWKRKGVATWRDRIRELERLGLILVDRQHNTAKVQYVLVLEPVRILLQLAGAPTVPPALKDFVKRRVMHTTRTLAQLT